MIYKRILALITLILLVIGIVLVNKKAKKQMPNTKIKTEIKNNK